MSRMNFSTHVMNVFNDMNTSYDEIKNLMFDLYKGELDEGISKKDAEDKLREMSLKIFGLTKDAKKRERIRAYEEFGRQFFNVIEEVTDWTVSTGLKENEWFNELVNYRNLNDGDENLFKNEHEEVILSVARMGKRHHDTMLQRLPEGETYSVETDLYGAAVGADIDKYLIGQEDWTKLIDAITKAFVVMVQDLIFAEVLNAPKKLPVQTGFVETGALNTQNRGKFNKVLQNVSVANDNAEVVIMGTMVGLQELENLVNVNWIAASQKEAVASMGRLGNYGRYRLGVDAIEDTGNAADSAATSIASFDEAWLNLKNTDDSDLKGAADDLLDLANAGQLTGNALEGLAGGQQLMNETGLSAEALAQKINGLVSL